MKRLFPRSFACCALGTAALVCVALARLPGAAAERTLTGLGSAKVAKALAEAFGPELVDAVWKRRTPKARAETLLQHVNAALAGLGVPMLKHRLANLEDDAGQFEWGRWQILLDRTTFEKTGLSAKEKTELVDTLAHEARHAEQRFRCARRRAAEGQRPEEIAAALELSVDRALMALEQPLAGSSREAREADAWDGLLCAGCPGRKAEEQVLTRREQAAQTHREAKARKEQLEQQGARLKQLARAERELRRAAEAHLAAWWAYRRLVDEADAFAVGARAGAYYRIWRSKHR